MPLIVSCVQYACNKLQGKAGISSASLSSCRSDKVGLPQDMSIELWSQLGMAQHKFAVQHSTAQHSTTQRSPASTAQHSTAHHSAAQHSTAQHSTAQHSTEQPDPAHHITP